MPSFSLVGAIEFRQVVASLQTQATSSSLNIFDSPVTPYVGGHYHVRRRSRSTSVSPHPPPESGEWGGALGVPLNDRSPRLLRTSISEEPDHEETRLVDVHENEARTPLSIPTIPSITHTPASLTEAPTLPVTEDEEQIPPTWSQRLFHGLARTWHILFPSLHQFQSKTLAGKIVSLLAVPAIMALTITLPVVITPYGNDGSHEEKIDQYGTPLPEFEEEGVERALIAEHEVQEDLHEAGFNKWLTAVQCIFGPLFCVTVLFSASSPRCDERFFLTWSRWEYSHKVGVGWDGPWGVRACVTCARVFQHGLSPCCSDGEMLHGVPRRYHVDYGDCRRSRERPPGNYL